MPVEANGLARYPFQSSVLLVVGVSAHSCLPSISVTSPVEYSGSVSSPPSVLSLNGSPLDGAHSTSGVPVTMARSVWVSPSLTPLSVPVTLTDSPGLSTRVSQLSG